MDDTSSQHDRQKEMVEWDKAIEQHVKGEKKLEPYLQEIVARIRFKLVGYDLNAKPADPEPDFQAVEQLERQLVLDPEEVQRELEGIRKQATTLEEQEQLSTAAPLSEKGFQSHSVKRRILERVRYQRGYIIQAVILDDEGREWTLAYNYGLDRMPNMANKGDYDFEYHDISTVSDPESYMPTDHLDEIAINWRTSVRPEIPALPFRQQIPDAGERDAIPIRRLGIGSALKFIIANLAERRKQKYMSFNIGTLYAYEKEKAQDERIKIRNAVSFKHNKGAWGESWGETGVYRTRKTGIAVNGPHGFNKTVAYVQWFARWPRVQAALDNLRASNSVLATRNYDMQNLEEAVNTIEKQLKKEKKSKIRQET